MGEFAECSSSPDEVADNTYLVQQKNPALDCPAIGGGLCCAVGDSGIPLYNFCPVSCDGQSEDCA